MASPPSSLISAQLERVRADLYGRVLPFWCAHSVDAEHGGFFNNLDEDGAVFDTHKHVWLQGRQCWMFARIANAHTDASLAEAFAKYGQGLPTSCDAAKTKAAVTPIPLTRASLVAAARRGVQFLRDHAVRKEDGHVLFCLDREGRPALHQRKPFSATFLIMALAEVGRATGEQALLDEAKALLDRVLVWIRTPGSLGKEGLPGAPQLEPLNVPMIILNVVTELMRCFFPGDASAPGGLACDEAKAFYREEREWCAREILKHAHGTTVLESVRADGSADLSCPEGRLSNPGHAIEAGWFLLEYAQFTGDSALAARALEVIEWSWAAGWDRERGGGGMLYFKDVEGFTPTQLEWSMKLWWPVNESMIALAMAYEHTME
jgi:N-acylglucosamine 2-epimerase